MTEIELLIEQIEKARQALPSLKPPKKPELKTWQEMLDRDVNIHWHST